MSDLSRCNLKEKDGTLRYRIMEITGIIVKKLGESSGTSAKTGMPWRIAEFLVEIPGEYKRHINFKVRDGQYNLIARFDALIGKTASISFNCDAKEQEKDGQKTGRWFNEITAWGVLEYKPEQISAGDAIEQAKQGGSFDDLMQKDAVAAVAQKLNESGQ